MLPTNQIREDKSWLTKNEDGSITIVYTSGSNINFTNLFTEPLSIPTGNYKLKLFVTGTYVGGNMLIMNSNNTSVAQAQITDGRTFTITNSDIANIQLYVLSAGTNCTIRFELEEGTAEPTSYEPYGTNQWYLKKNIGKVVLDGSESSSLWRLDTSGGFYRETITINGINGYVDSNRHIGRFLCNRFKPDTNNGIGNVLQFKYTLLFYVPSGIATTADWQTWLSNNNVIVYYQLAIPTYTQITGTLETQLNNIYEKLLSYKGTTNISQVNNDLPFVLGVSAIQDLE